jgi:Uma2 family endonuclease
MLVETLISKEEYFDLLIKSDVKLEYHDGEVVAMAGAQPAHNTIGANLNGELFQCLKKAECLILTSDQLIKIEDCRKYVYPDLVIVCKNPVYEKSPNGLDALLNPEIIIEILSDSTELFDRSTKFECYKTLESFKEYILVSTNKKQVEVHKKLNENEWIERTFTEKDVSLKIGNCEILLEDIYRKVGFEQKTAV